MADRRYAFLDVNGGIGNRRHAIKLPIFLFMQSEHSSETTRPAEDQERTSGSSSLPNSSLGRRWFLQSMGRWSGAAIAAAIVGGAWLAAPPGAQAGAWVNRRAGGGVGGWINGRGGGGGGAWHNGGGGGGGGWINRRGYGGGGAWVNRW
jgi:hypothetical protein